MNRDDIIRMAQEAGLTFVTEFGVASAPPEWIERFAALVAAAEREACAKIADMRAATQSEPDRSAESIAWAIRRRGQP